MMLMNCKYIIEKSGGINMRYLVVWDEDRVTKFESKNEAIDFLQCRALNDIDEYCEDYDIDIEDASPERLGEISFRAGYESGDIKVYNVNKILKNIDKVKLDDEEDKEELKEILKSNFSEISLNYYEGLEEILEYVEEENIYY